MIKSIFKVFNSKRIDMLLLFKRFMGIKYTLFHLKSGEYFKIRNIDKVGIEVLKNTFELTLANALLSKLKKGMTVLDIGANIGYYTVLMANRVGDSGRVIAFEPNPVVYDELKANIELNRFKNVEIMNIALSNTTGESVFFFPAEGREAHGSMRSNNTFTSTRIEYVKTDRLDDVLIWCGINKVDLIKMDVEGAELLVMRGANDLLTGKLKPIIFFECAENQCSSFGFRVFDVLSEIVSFGYFIEQIDFGNWIAVPKQESSND